MSRTLMLVCLWVCLAPVTLPVQAQSVDDFVADAQREMDAWNHENAIEACDRALALDGDHSRALFLRAMAKRETGDREGALLDLDHVIELVPDSPEYFYERGTLKYYVQDYRGAVVDFDAFLELVPDSEFILQLSGESKMQLQDYAGAVADYSRALELDPQNPEVHYLRAYAQMEREDYEGAIRDFTAVMDIPPRGGMEIDRSDMALVRRAEVKRRAGDFPGAQADCDRALERNDGELEARFIRALVRVELERFDEAIGDLDIVIDRYPLPEVYQARGKARQGLGDAEGAALDFQRAEEMRQQRP